jgi:signal transduction histidine kinase/ActR/RegA family two-component response regulator
MSVPRPPRWPRLFVRSATGILLTASMIVLAGWAQDIHLLESVVPGWPQMAPLTALCFLLAGIALACVGGSEITPGPAAGQRPPSLTDWLGNIAAAAVLLVGGTRVGFYLLGRSSHIDHLLFRSSTARMSLLTALDFVLAGSALLCVRSKRYFRCFQALILFAALLGWLGVSRFVYGGKPLFLYDQMAVHTALLFLILSAGLLCARTDRGLMSLLVSYSAGGTICRALLPPALLIPVLVGWLRLQGQRAGWYATETGTSLSALSDVVLFCGLIWAAAAGLHRADLQRRQAEHKAFEQLARLDLLHTITQATGERQDLDSIFQVVIRSLEESLPVDCGCVALYDIVARVLTVTNVGVRTPALTALKRARIDIGQQALARCLKNQLLHEADMRGQQGTFFQQLSEAGLRALILAPLFVDNRLFGAVIVARREVNSFNGNDSGFLKQLSEHLNLSIRQTRLYSGLQHAYEDLRSTQQVAMQQQRLSAFGEMAAGIAHDINNAISPVTLYTQSLLDTEPALSANVRAMLEVIHQATNDALHTLTRLKSLYRKGKPQSSLTPVNLDEIVRQTVELTHARWSTLPRQQGISIDLVLRSAPELPAIAGIESEIREVLVNLIFNAVDAMPQGGTLTLRTGVIENGQRSGPAKIFLEVADSGNGMDEVTQKRCMEPFFTTKGDRGTGLGLPMVYDVAERHGAELQLNSAVGVGTTIRLTFAAAAVSREEPLPALPKHFSVAPLRILLVDDDPLLARSLCEVLKIEGHEVVTALGGQEGIDAFYTAWKNGKPYEVVITDLSMPYVDGKKVASTVKEVTAAVSVILLTGWGHNLEEDSDVPPHVDVVLTKPTNLNDLRKALLTGRLALAG